MSTSHRSQAPYAEVLPSDQLRWPAIAFLFLTPVIAAGALALQIGAEGFAFTDLIPFVFMYWACGLAITMGYHRLYAHRTYQAHPIVQFFLLLFGAASVQNSLLNWASDHRFHHRHVDQEGDPYAITRGFFWAHMGWMLRIRPGDVNRPFQNASDLKKNRLVAWQHRWYWTLAVVVGLGFPMLIGAAFGRPWAGLVWGGLIRMVVGHHATFMINSVAHTFGQSKHAGAGTARDAHWLALISFGEGYHSYHHAYAGDYRIGARAWEWDPGKWAIWSLQWVGLTGSLKRARATLPASARGDTLSKDDTFPRHAEEQLVP